MFYRSKPSISVGRCGIVPSKRERIDCTSRFLARLSIGGYGKELRIFSYSINEALHLSEQEEKMIKEIMDNIKHETEMNIDAFTQDLLVSNIDLLLKYCDRFYNRQFLTRKK